MFEALADVGVLQPAASTADLTVLLLRLWRVFTSRCTCCCDARLPLCPIRLLLLRLLGLLRLRLLGLLAVLLLGLLLVLWLLCCLVSYAQSASCTVQGTCWAAGRGGAAGCGRAAQRT